MSYQTTSSFELDLCPTAEISSGQETLYWTGKAITDQPVKPKETEPNEDARNRQLSPNCRASTTSAILETVTRQTSKRRVRGQARPSGFVQRTIYPTAPLRSIGIDRYTFVHYR